MLEQMNVRKFSSFIHFHPFYFLPYFQYLSKNDGAQALVLQPIEEALFAAVPRLEIFS